MDDFVVEFAIWISIVAITFYVFNELCMFKRFASVLFAATVASFVIFAVYASVLSEILVTATFVVWGIYGITQAFRAVRSDAKRTGGSRYSDDSLTAG